LRLDGYVIGFHPKDLIVLCENQNVDLHEALMSNYRAVISALTSLAEERLKSLKKAKELALQVAKL
jgi:hypothetical protein